MTSKCGKNKKVAHEAIAECVTDVLLYYMCTACIIPTSGDQYIILLSIDTFNFLMKKPLKAGTESL